MSFNVTILGSNSALPAFGRNHTAQLVQVEEMNLLIDCGEGTQLQLAKYAYRIQKIDHIFISHLHGDHYLGLMGLISTMNLNRRTKPLHVYSHSGLDEIITVQLKYSHSVLHFPIEFVHLKEDDAGILFENDKIEITYFPLNHRIPCSGFRIQEKPKPYKINKEMLSEDIKLQYMALFKQGKHVLDEKGDILFNFRDYTLPPKKSRSYAYCSDTAYFPPIIQFIKNVDLLYHEATFLSDNTVRAEYTYHSTASQAAEIAKAAGAEKLVIGHYSARYRQLSPFAEEAKQVFPNTQLAIEGETFSIPEI